MILSSLATGFVLAFSLIMAIGAQNAFVLRQGLLRQHVLAVVLFCGLSDTILIFAGVAGISLFIADFAERHSAAMFGLAAIWLAIYGAMRLRDAWRGGAVISTDGSETTSLAATLGTLAILTYGNPHVYLDTVVLIGTVSLQFTGIAKLSFAIGAASASLTFFFMLGFGATLLAPQMTRPGAWRVLDTLIGVVMFVLAAGMAAAGGWLTF